MPTYEYVCRSCNTHLEVVQRFHDAPLSECPTCTGALRKVFGSIGIAFKGSGFYKTDSRKSSKKAVGASSKSAEGGSDTGKGSASSGGAESSGGSDTSSSDQGGKGGGKDKPAKESKSSGSADSAPAAKTA